MNKLTKNRKMNKQKIKEATKDGRKNEWGK